ncbi:hypothetical protein BA059_14820 [Mycolicibacterium sp. (ex Dasyatis americana)]|nr:hypothetical protein BA059_14820 [Mycolicibacterium sp. (ex Dasyatis americana)]
MAGGFSTYGEVLKTADKVPIDSVWEEALRAVEAYNREKRSIVQLLSYETTVPGDYVPQSLQARTFEDESEFGVPRSIGPGPKPLLVGYTMLDKGASTRFTCKYVREATSEQYVSDIREAFNADSRTVTEMVMNRLFDPAAETNGEGMTCYGLYTGADSVRPPSFMGKSFASDHVHLLASGAATLDSEDIELLQDHVLEHGYGGPGGTGQLLLLVNPAEGRTISRFRAGVTNNNSKVANYDFIPAKSAPSYLSDMQIVGAQPPEDVNGIPVLGSYYRAYVLESFLVPLGYVACVATAGVDNPGNVIGRRTHPDPAWQGLRLLPGHFQNYPIVESFYHRTLGVGVRHRGAAAVLQVTAGSYSVPTIVGG